MFELNNIYCGDSLELIKKIPEKSVDVVFADPPYNLNKKYKDFKDKKSEQEYWEWSREWLFHCVRILKESGSLFVLNIPKYSIRYAHFLNNFLEFKHWICWDSLSSPMGKSLQPSHYSLLYYVKNKKKAKVFELRSPHKRDRKNNFLLKDYGGKKALIHPFGPLVSDVWTDIFRVKHKSKREKHPCQLPTLLIDRVILLSSEEGDIIFDPFMGVGTTAVSAKSLGRKFLGFEISPSYIEIAEKALKSTIESKIGDIWVSLKGNEIVTLRDIDWEKLQEFFIIPENRKDLDFTKIKLK